MPIASQFTMIGTGRYGDILTYVRLTVLILKDFKFAETSKATTWTTLAIMLGLLIRRATPKR